LFQSRCQLFSLNICITVWAHMLPINLAVIWAPIPAFLSFQMNWHPSVPCLYVARLTVFCWPFWCRCKVQFFRTWARRVSGPDPWADVPICPMCLAKGLSVYRNTRVGLTASPVFVSVAQIWHSYFKATAPEACNQSWFLLYWNKFWRYLK